MHMEENAEAKFCMCCRKDSHTDKGLFYLKKTVCEWSLGKKTKEKLFQWTFWLLESRQPKEILIREKHFESKTDG